MNAKLRTTLFATVIMFTLVLAACGSGDAEEAPYLAADSEAYVEDYAAEESMEMDMADSGGVVAAEAEKNAPEAVRAPEPQTGSGDGLFSSSTSSDRMIIKNADMNLLVAETDVAIQRLTQIVGDFGGYIISSREWVVDWYGDNYKNATYTFAVPVDQFERALNRLRDISVEVLDEYASGEDVTQEFVDLDSRLTNLEATRDRIRTFLEQAKTVQEALEVNEELSKIDAQIEQTKGRMNYLSGRAAFSTITVTLTADLPEFVPTATATPTATSTPTATPTATPWKPGETFERASNTLGASYRSITELLIWLLVVVVPIFAPFVLIIWFFVAQANKRTRNQATEKKNKEKK